MDRDKALWAAVAILALYAGVALYVLVDDLKHRRAQTGRWTQLLADAAEASAAERARGGDRPA